MPPVNRLAPQPANSFAEYGPYGPVTSDPAASAAYQQQLVSGLGSGLANQLRGMYQTVRHAATSRPIDDIRGALASLAALYDDPMQALQALREMRQRAMSGPQGLGQVLGELAPLPGPNNALRRAPRMELDVYHGTPHRFEPTEANPLGEFDASKIGTGEGMQAYGHGVYYAENPEVAKGYQPRDPKAEAKLMNLYKQAEARQNYDAMEVLEAAMLHRTASELREQYPNQKALVNRIGKINEKAAGALYKADLPDEMIDRMLDWDKPLSEQPTAVREAIETRLRHSNSSRKFLEKNPTGAELYGVFQNRGDYINPIEASEAFREAGIPGIKYSDAGSRGQGGSSTRNFVVFPGEEKKVRILERK